MHRVVYIPLYAIQNSLVTLKIVESLIQPLDCFFLFFFFLATPGACQARDRTHATAVIRAIAVTTPDP